MALKTPKPPPRSRPAGGIQRGNLLPAPPFNHDAGDAINAATYCPPRLPFRRHTSPQRNTLLYMSDSSLSPARTQVVEGGCEPHRGSSPHIVHITEAHLLT